MRVTADDPGQAIPKTVQHLSHSPIPKVGSEKGIGRRGLLQYVSMQRWNSKQIFQGRRMQHHYYARTARGNDPRSNAIDLVAGDLQKVDTIRHKLEITPSKRRINRWFTG